MLLAGLCGHEEELVAGLKGVLTGRGEDTGAADDRHQGRVLRPLDVADLVTIIRGTRVLTPTREDSLEPGDELLFVAAQAREEQLEDLLSVRKDSTGS